MSRPYCSGRDHAVQIGQKLVDAGFLHHVTHEHPFKDEDLFYRLRPLAPGEKILRKHAIIAALTCSVNRHPRRRRGWPDASSWCLDGTKSFLCRLPDNFSQGHRVRPSTPSSGEPSSTTWWSSGEAPQG